MNDRERLAAALSQRYRLERELGQGGMALVYLAEDLKHGRWVALKVLRPDLAAALGGERFFREIDITASLDHPQILPLLDSGEADGFLYYVMPYVEGESLRSRLNRERQLPLDEAIQIAREVADALSYAHSRGIVHRDIKPENILLSGGHARVADFGIARAATAAGGETLTETGITIGTPAYMSPEQASGEKALDNRSDLYSLGCVLYEMLAGHPPFTGATAREVLSRHSLDAVPSLVAARPTVQPALEQAIKRALAKVPADRFATAQEFALSLERAFQAPRHSAFPSKRRVAVLGGMLVIFVALGATGWWLVNRRRADVRPVDSIVVLPFEDLSPRPAEEYVTAGMHAELIGDLSRVAALRVIAPSSARKYTPSDESVASIAQRFGVRGIVKTAMVRSADSVRLQVELIGARPERILWAHSFSLAMADISEGEAQVAQAIISASQVPVTRQEASRLSTIRDVAPNAQEAYMKGAFFIEKLTADGFAKGFDYLQQAIAAEPTWAPPYALLAEWYVFSTYTGSSPTDALPKARAAAERALKLDSTLAEAHASLGLIEATYDWDWTRADQEYREALTLKPSLSRAHAEYATYLSIQGRHRDALREARRALELDPLSNFTRGQLALVLTMAHLYEEAIQQSQEAIRLDTAFDVGYYRLAWALFDAGRKHEAIGPMQHALSLSGGSDPRWIAFAAELDAFAGETGRARQLLGKNLRASGDRYVGGGPATIASIYVGLGNAEEAMRWLQRAYDSRDIDLAYHLAARRMDRIRADPRFQSFLRRMRLPQLAHPDLGAVHISSRDYP